MAALPEASSFESGSARSSEVKLWDVTLQTLEELRERFRGTPSSDPAELPELRADDLNEEVESADFRHYAERGGKPAEESLH